MPQFIFQQSWLSEEGTGDSHHPYPAQAQPQAPGALSNQA